MTTIAPTLDLARLLHEARIMAPEVIAWRRQLHQRPEVAFHEHETSQFVREILAGMPELVVTRPTETSVMARLIGATPGRVVAVRADMDALPIHEENDVAYRSRVDGAITLVDMTGIRPSCLRSPRSSRGIATSSPEKCGSSFNMPKNSRRAAPKKW